MKSTEMASLTNGGADPFSGPDAIGVAPADAAGSVSLPKCFASMLVKSEVWIGLLKKSSIPAFRARSFDSAKASAVSAMMITLFRGGGRARIRRVASNPSITGVCTSMRTTSNVPVVAASTATLPFSHNTPS